MSKNEQFDLVVIGAGTGALGVARPCAKVGWKVAIVDCLPYGGTCALRGCDPKKMLVAVTEAINWSDHMRGNGVQGNEISIDWAKMIAFKRTFTDAMPKRLENNLEKMGVVQLHGTARFTTPGIVQVGDRELHARYFHIATGARPVTLDIPGEELLTTSTEFLELESIPSRIVFIGGGYIAFEFAHIARRAGASEVTILQRGKRPLVQFDPDLVDLQMERTRELGIDIRCESCVETIVKDGDDLRVELATSRGYEKIVCDLVVHGAGRVPNIDALNLEAAGVEVGNRGIQVNGFMRSISNPAVFAAGDCADTEAPNLTPVSANEARIAAKNMLAGKDDRRVKYPPIPSVVFTLPPMARVGLLEDQARQKGVDFEVNFQRTDHWYSTLRVGERYSGCKVLVEKGTGKILGAHVIGPGAEEQINLFTMAMGAGISANQLKAVIFAYPSYASDLGSMVQKRNSNPRQVEVIIDGDAIRRYTRPRRLAQGMSANLCTESHMREFMEQGFEVMVVSDAVAAAQVPGLDGYAAAMTNVRMIANSVKTTDQTIKQIKEELQPGDEKRIIAGNKLAT